MEPHEERRLTTILSADVVGYSRLMAADEAGTLAQLKTHRKELLDPKMAEYNGRVVKLTGDGALMEFASVVDAVGFAVDVQRAMLERNASVPEDHRIIYRVGINIGDIIVEGDDIYGDGVNVAARLQEMAEPGGICVSRTVFNHAKGKVDYGFEDLCEQALKNIPEPVQVYRVLIDHEAAAGMITSAKRPVRKPWRWAMAAAVAMVAVGAGAAALWWQPWAPDLEPVSVEEMAFSLPDKPSIAILPFKNLSTDPRQEVLADAFTDEIITELSRSRLLFVIASTSVFTYKGKSVKVRDVARDLGVQYVLEGSIQRAGDRLRITAQLIDGITDTHIWAETYDREAEDIFSVQDEVAQEIVATMGPGTTTQVAKAVRDRAKRKPPASLKAYEYFLLGLELSEQLTKESMAEGRKLLEKAIELDPSLARAYAELAWTHYFASAWGWSEDPDMSAEKALEYAKKAVAVDDADSKAHWALGYVHSKITKNYDLAVAEYERALNLNPNYADLIASWGGLLARLGRAKEGADAAQTAMRINPHYPDWYSWILGYALYGTRSYDVAISALQRIREHNPSSRVYLVASYAQVGQKETAQALATEILRANPDFSSEQHAETEAYKNKADTDHLIEGLRKAGLPD